MQTLGQAGSKSLGQTLAALGAGVALVAAVTITISASMPVLLPMVATQPQPVHFLFTSAILALVLVGTMAGGYLTARLVRQAEARNSLILGSVALMTALWWLRIGAPAWFVGVIFLLSIPTAWMGGQFRARQKGKAEILNTAGR